MVKFVLCTLVSRVHMTFYILTKGDTVPGNQGTHGVTFYILTKGDTFPGNQGTHNKLN